MGQVKTKDSDCGSVFLNALTWSVSLCRQITQLKIDNNPFAKGFRDTGNGRREKRYQPAARHLT